MTQSADWTTNAPQYATVDGGGVRGIAAAGTATLTVTYDGQTATHPMTVTAAAVTTTSVTVSGAQTVRVDETVTLTAQAQRSDGTTLDVTQSADWTTDAPQYATVDGGVVRGIAAGTATLTVTYDGQTAAHPMTVTAAPDLVVGSPTVNDSSPATGQAFTLSAMVRNAGDGAAAATTLRYRRSTDGTITTSDTSVGTDAVGGLAAGAVSVESISLTAPSTAGTYYYGACVDAVTDESNTANNCSAAVTVTVAGPTPNNPPVRAFNNCDAMHSAGWTRGVNQNGGTYQSSWDSAERQTYQLNTARDRDGDGHACE